MAKMTPEREAAYALDFGVARIDLSPEAQRAYDRLAEQRAHARARAPFSGTPDEAAGAPVAMSRWAAALGTAVFVLIAQGAGMVLLPYAFTRWQPGTPPWPVVLFYAAAFLAVTFILSHWIEDPALARRFGRQFEDYRNRVPGWWPRLPRRTPNMTTQKHHG